MTTMTSYPEGRFCWIELSTTDVTAAKKFYGPLLGWSWDEHPMGPGEVYSMGKIANGQICGAYTLNPEQKKQGVPPNWGVYVAVDSVDVTAKKAAELGGKILVPAFDVMDVGRMATIQDPTGATFNLWQAKKHAGAAVVNEPGAFDWFELSTSDPVKAAAYYAKLFGWTTSTMDMGPMKYTMCMLGETPVGGITSSDPKMKAPPAWVVYFNVTDVDAVVRNAREMGAQVLVPPTDVPNMVRFAILQDAQHAVFGVAKSLKPAGAS
jgi:predicted enzyme related to lactoylglutathione lyase